MPVSGQKTGQLRTYMYVYDKRDNFSFEIINFPFMYSNIPADLTYGVYISQLVRIRRICEPFVLGISCLPED